MSITPHVAVGAAIGSLTGNLLLAGIAGFASHFVLDFIPHFDLPATKGVKRKKVINWILFLTDLGIGLGILWLVRDYPAMIVGGFVGALVDLENFYRFIPIHHSSPGWHNKTTLIKGLFNQGVVASIGMIVVFAKLGLFK